VDLESDQRGGNVLFWCAVYFEEEKTMSLHFNLLTLFPEMFPGSLDASLAGKALARGDWSYACTDLRGFGHGAHSAVDDAPYGGGAGMVMRADVLDSAVRSMSNAGRKVYLSPRGKVLSQDLVKELAAEPVITMLCGRYEGVDQRVLDAQGFEEISIGDYVLSGGEPAALIVMDACVRLLPGVMGNVETADDESFGNGAGGMLEYPHYTRPNEWVDADGEARGVPDVLTSGDHKKIAQWRAEKSLEITTARRPDLLLKK
jgi:tRNA (guanine37-N1)-methyltransferase